MAIEVEVKARVKDPKKLSQKLKDYGAKFIGEVKQLDQYFNSPVKDLRKQEPREFIRVRDKGGKSELGYHIALGKDSAKEYEIICDDSETTHKILEFIGCKKLGLIDKTRKKYTLTWNGTKYNIVVDDVKKLGLFIEFEIMVEKESEIPATQKKIKALMDEMGFENEDLNVERFSHIATK